MPRRRRRPAKKHLQLLDRARPYYDKLLEGQGGVCAICGNPPSSKRRLDIDHEHSEPMYVRGLLCVSCNRRLWKGMTPSWLRCAANYLDRGRIDWLEDLLRED